MEITYILYGLLILFALLIAVIIYLYIELDKLKKRVIVEGMAGALSDEAIQNIASVYNNNNELVVPKLRVTGDAIFENGATMMESANNTCLRLQTKLDKPSYPDGAARIEFLNKDGSRVAWTNSHAHGIDHTNKAYNFWIGSLNAPGLTATGDVTTIGGALNANKDVNVAGNLNITGNTKVSKLSFDNDMYLVSPIPSRLQLCNNKRSCDRPLLLFSDDHSSIMTTRGNGSQNFFGY